MKLRRFPAALLACATLFNLSLEAAEWKALFDGKSLDGWVQRGGKADYAVEDGMIVGTTVPKTPNSFLCTDRDYSDFILEVEFKVDTGLNSGIQIRSQSLPDYKDGRVHGYQVEIDPSDRAWSGGIYDEGRRGWLNNLKENEPARKAFRRDEWNLYRIEAIGDRIRTWINGVPAADLKDDMTPAGFIALQVHGIGSKPETFQVRWRNIRLLDLAGTAAASLFDGSNLDAWQTRDGKPVQQGWEIAGTTLHRADKGGDVFTREEYGDFILELDWKISPGGNSGIKYRVTQYGNAMLGPEYQVLDDDKHPDGQKRDGRRKSGALYDLFRANEHKHLNPVGEWNHTRIVVVGQRAEHWLNGRKVLEYDTTSEDWKREHAASKFVKQENFAANAQGRIMLQDHNDEVWYRNITLRKL